MPWLTRSLGALLTKAPRVYGWCRPRWRWAPLAATLQTTHGIEVSADTVGRWLHERGGVWKRATRVAKDDDPQRSKRFARMRLHHDPLQAHAVIVCADARAMPLLPKVGAAWMRQGAQAESRTPGTHEQHSLAGALHLETGKVLYCFGARKNHGVFRERLTLLATTSPASRVTRIDGVADNSWMHKAKAVEQWVVSHPRLTLLWFPTYCPRANPMERVCGDVHDKCTRNHQRKRLRDLVQDVERHMEANGPWQYRLSHLYDALAVTAAVEHLAAEEQAKIAA
jgi:hypothetical protein